MHLFGMILALMLAKKVRALELTKNVGCESEVMGYQVRSISLNVLDLSPGAF